jgi:hypothetical protein
MLSETAFFYNLVVLRLSAKAKDKFGGKKSEVTKQDFCRFWQELLLSLSLGSLIAIIEWFSLNCGI